MCNIIECALTRFGTGVKVPVVLSKLVPVLIRVPTFALKFQYNFCRVFAGLSLSLLPLFVDGTCQNIAVGGDFLA